MNKLAFGVYCMVALVSLAGIAEAYPSRHRSCFQRPFVAGPCDDYFIPAYSYDQKTGTCKEFDYGGCGGNENRFYIIEECEFLCIGEVRSKRNADVQDELDKSLKELEDGLDKTFKELEDELDKSLKEFEDEMNKTLKELEDEFAKLMNELESLGNLSDQDVSNNDSKNQVATGRPTSK